MASLKKLPANKSIISKKASLPRQLQAFLADIFLSQKRINPKLLLAYSGGLDSTVLLHLLVEINNTIPFKLTAQHVHHGLSANADVWADFCAQVCKKLNVPLSITKVQVSNIGLGIEAAARAARYQALEHAQEKSDADFILLAHHQDDQAETFLLQLARGAGVKGLAGMAAQQGKFLRPFLDAPRRALLDYAKQHRLTWIEDESNADTQFDRNFIRHKVLPKLQKQYPAIQQTISRSAQHMASANDLLDELAQNDAKQAGFHIPLKANSYAPLSLAHLTTLSENRVNNCLRWWLAQNGAQMPSAQQLQQISQQLMHAKLDANIAIKVSESLTLRRYQNNAYLVQDCSPNAPINLLWQGEEEIILTNKTKLIFSKQMGQGISLRKIENAKLRIKFREGSERFLPELGRPRRSLKVMLQNHEMPPWQRDQLPLIFMDETLVMIPNVGVAADFKASSAENGLLVNWIG
jgi:tRNA(Ile)-lysidine synthase